MNDTPNQPQNIPAQPEPIQPEPAQPEPVQPEPMPIATTTNTASAPTPEVTPTPEATSTQTLEAAPTLTPEVAPTPGAAPTPTSTPATETTSTPNATTKKKHTGLIASIIIGIIVLIGGGAIAALAIIKSSPESMFIDSISNLATANQVIAKGNLDLTLSNANNYTGIQSIKLDFDAERANSNQHAETNLQITFTDGTSTNLLNIGEMMLQNGIFYLHLGGINELYQNTLRSSLTSVIENNIRSQYRSQAYNNCYATSSSYYDCVSNININTTEINALITSKSAQLLTEVDKIVAKIDNQWFEFSIEDILNSDFLSGQLSIPNDTKQNIISTYNCYVDIINQMPTKYSPELSNLYSQNPFVKLTPSQDNYYSLSLDANHLASYFNNTPKLSLYQDAAKCTNTSIPTDDYQITAEDISSELQNFPNIAVRFDGFINHHLTDVKISQSDDGYYDLKMNINFAYPSNLQVSVPSDSRPIMDLVQEIYTTIVTTFQI